MSGSPCHVATIHRPLCRIAAVGWVALSGCLAAEDLGGEVVALEGRLQRLVVTPPDPARGAPRTAYVLETRDRGDIELVFPARVAAAAEADLASGAFVEVRARRLSPGMPGPAAVLGYQTQLAVQSWRQTLPAPPAEATALAPQALIVDPSAPPIVPRKVAAILVNFQNDPNTTAPSVEQVRNQVFLDAKSTAVFYKEISYGHVALGGKVDPKGDVFGYYTVPFDNTPCREGEWGRAAMDAAAAAGQDLTGYDHYIFIFPSTSACQYAGLGQQPGKNTWINGLRPEAKRVHHELGHNFNLRHATSQACTDAAGARVTLSATCTKSEYGNPYDVMGSGPRQTNVVNKARGRWLAGPNIKDITATGTYDLLPAELPSNDVQMLRIGRNADEAFYIEYRQPLGVFDGDFPANDPAVNGVILLIGAASATSMSANMLDANPQTTTFVDAPLGVGQTFEDPLGNVRITLAERTPQVAKVRVEMGGAPPPPPADGGAQPPSDAGAVPPPPAADAGALPPPPMMGVDAAAAPTPPPATPDAATAPGKVGTVGCNCHLGGGRGRNSRQGGLLVELLVAAVAGVVFRRAAARTGSGAARPGPARRRSPPCS
jgi:hypothetical protein